MAVEKSWLLEGITPAPGYSLALSDCGLSCDDALWVLEPRELQSQDPRWRPLSTFKGF